MLLSKSKLTLSLKKKKWYISSFYNAFVFGIVDSNKYDSFVEIEAFEFLDFYNQIRKMTNFLVTESVRSIKKTYFKSNDTISVFWEGNFENEKKIVKIFNEIEGNVTVSNLILDSNIVEALLLNIPMIFFSCLNLSCSQKYFLDFLSNKQKAFLLSLKNDDKKMLDLLKEFQILFPLADIYDHHQLFFYFFEELLVLNDIRKIKPL